MQIYSRHKLPALSVLHMHKLFNGRVAQRKKKDVVANRAARTLWFMSQSWEFQLPGVFMYTQSRKWFLLQKSSNLK